MRDSGGGGGDRVRVVKPCTCSCICELLIIATIYMYAYPSFSLHVYHLSHSLSPFPRYSWFLFWFSGSFCHRL